VNGPLRLGGVAALILALAGCGGGGATVRGGAEELPVSCVSRVGAGSCPPGSRAYYYDYQSDRCRGTGASGCGGRTVFDTLEDCVRFCGARP
jgi:Kunitz/Bovine pancreatic trypsin inhibitor domain